MVETNLTKKSLQNEESGIKKIIIEKFRQLMKFTKNKVSSCDLYSNRILFEQEYYLKIPLW